MVSAAGRPARNASNRTARQGLGTGEVAHVLFASMSALLLRTGVLQCAGKSLNIRARNGVWFRPLRPEMVVRTPWRCDELNEDEQSVD